MFAYSILIYNYTVYNHFLALRCMLLSGDVGHVSDIMSAALTHICFLKTCPHVHTYFLKQCLALLQVLALYTCKQHFRSLKSSLLENSNQGEDIQRLCYQCLHLYSQTQRSLETKTKIHMFISVCSIIRKCELEVYVMTLEYLSLYCDGMDVILFDFIFGHKRTMVIQRFNKKRMFTIFLTNYPRGFCEEPSHLPTSFIVFSVAKQPTRVSSLLPV